jgi:hypothetical protein
MALGASGASVKILDRTYGHLLAGADAYERSCSTRSIGAPLDRMDALLVTKDSTGFYCVKPAPGTSPMPCKRRASLVKRRVSGRILVLLRPGDHRRRRRRDAGLTQSA